MNALQVAAKVAVHPVIVKLRAQQDAMRQRMVRDYGDDFMIAGKDMPEMVMPNGRKSPRFVGVHYWTPAQRNAWFVLETRLRNARAALRGAYTQAA